MKIHRIINSAVLWHDRNGKLFSTTKLDGKFRVSEFDGHGFLHTQASLCHEGVLNGMTRDEDGFMRDQQIGACA